MTGTWQANADGSVAVSLSPSPALGPGIPEDRSCIGTISVPPVAYPFAGTLVNGTFDVRNDLLPKGTVGTDWLTWHVASTPRS